MNNPVGSKTLGIIILGIGVIYIFLIAWLASWWYVPDCSMGIMRHSGYAYLWFATRTDDRVQDTKSCCHDGIKDIDMYYDRLDFNSSQSAY